MSGSILTSVSRRFIVAAGRETHIIYSCRKIVVKAEPLSAADRPWRPATTAMEQLQFHNLSFSSASSWIHHQPHSLFLPFPVQIAFGVSGGLSPLLLLELAGPRYPIPALFRTKKHYQINGLPRYIDGSRPVSTLDGWRRLGSNYEGSRMRSRWRQKHCSSQITAATTANGSAAATL